MAVDLTGAVWTLSPDGTYEVTQAVEYEFSQIASSSGVGIGDPINPTSSIYVRDVQDGNILLVGQLLMIDYEETRYSFGYNFVGNDLLLFSGTYTDGYGTKGHLAYDHTLGTITGGGVGEELSFSDSHEKVLISGSKEFDHSEVFVYDSISNYTYSPPNFYEGGAGYFFDNETKVFTGGYIIDLVKEEILPGYNGTAGDDRFNSSYFYKSEIFYCYAGNDYGWGLIGSDTIYGGDGNDTLFGDGDELLGDATWRDLIYGEEGNDYVEGGSANDTIYGGTGNDVLYGDDALLPSLGGADSIFGEAGNDSIKGGAGNDFASGGTGDDDVRGGDGQDTIYGNEGNDRLEGNFGNDFVSGAAGNDTVRGNAGDDTLFGGGGLDDVRGGDGNDSITGSGGNDTVVGDAGNDTVLGESGNDKLYGGDGNDILIGGTGGDALLGGAGMDVFTFLVLADSTAAARDNIRDFVHGEDVIDLRGLGFDGLVGKGAVGSHELKIAYSASSDRTYVRDSASSGFEFYLSGDHRADLTESDFLFV